MNADDTINECRLTSALTAAEYQSLSAELERTPDVTLRVSGSDRDLAKLEFLKWFPRLRRFSIHLLEYATDLSPLRHLPEELEYLDLGETPKQLDLTPTHHFTRINELRIVGHRRNLHQLVDRNRDIRGLSLWRLPVDSVMPTISQPRLESLAITRGSLRDPQWLTKHKNLRYLALRAVRGVADLEVLNCLASLEWLWLDGLSNVDSITDLTAHTRLQRIDLTEMRGLRESNALEGAAMAPNLEELLVSESRLPVDAFRPFAGHVRLKRVGVGLGSARRNQEVEVMLSRPPQLSHDEYAVEHELLFMK